MASRSNSVLAILACVVVMMALAQGTAATYHLVGGHQGWQVSQVEDRPTFYQDWADDNRPFEIRDTLVFNYMPNTTIVRVQTAGFYSCITTNNLGFYKSGNTLLPLAQKGRMYFISGDRLRCIKGMKFYVDVA